MASRFPFIKELPQGFRQGGLILLDRQQVITTPFQYLPGDLRLMPSCSQTIVIRQKMTGVPTRQTQGYCICFFGGSRAGKGDIAGDSRRFFAESEAAFGIGAIPTQKRPANFGSNRPDATRRESSSHNPGEMTWLHPRLLITSNTPTCKWQWKFF
jgi:hypothetical protein